MEWTDQKRFIYNKNKVYSEINSELLFIENEHQSLRKSYAENINWLRNNLIVLLWWLIALL